MDIDQRRASALRLRGITLIACAFGSLALSCARKSDPEQTHAVPARSAVPVASAASSAAQPAPRPPHPAEQFVFAWNAVMNRRAVDELAPFYSAKLLFYGQRKSATKVLTAKRLAFEKSPSFQQRVADVHIEKVADGFVVRFEKRSGARLESIVAGRLTLEATGDHLAIVDESDSATDQRFKSPTPSTCGDAVMQIVLSHPAILSDMARVAREYPSLSLGGMTYDEASDRVQSAVGYAHEDHFETRWEVEASGGKLRIQEDGDAPLSITPAQAAVVARLCTGVFPGAGN